MMDELNALNAPKKVVDGLTEVFEGLAQMFEGVSDQLELLGADAVPEGKRIFPVVDQKAPAVSEKKGSAAPHPRRKPIKKTRKVEEAVDKPEDPVNDSDSKEVKTDTLNLQATPLAIGYVKAKTGTNTTDDVYNKWFDAVYEPQAEAVDTDETSHTEEPQG